MKKIFYLLFILLSILSCKEEQHFFVGSINEQTLQKTLEECYFEGQKDALCGDIRIKKDSCNNYYWYKSPWDSGKLPIFKP